MRSSSLSDQHKIRPLCLVLTTNSPSVSLCPLQRKYINMEKFIRQCFFPLVFCIFKKELRQEKNIYFFIGNCMTVWHISLLWNPSNCHKPSENREERDKVPWRGSAGCVFSFLWKQAQAAWALVYCGHKDTKSGAQQLVRAAGAAVCEG